MKNVDMCIDNVMPLDREAWFSHVIRTNQTEPSYVCSLKSVNASHLIRPVSAMSSTSCHYEAKVHHDRRFIILSRFLGLIYLCPV